MYSVFDASVIQVHGDMYRSWVMQDPDQYPNERPAVLSNWDAEDLAAFVGGPYTATK